MHSNPLHRAVSPCAGQDDRADTLGSLKGSTCSCRRAWCRAPCELRGWCSPTPSTVYVQFIPLSAVLFARLRSVAWKGGTSTLCRKQRLRAVARLAQCLTLHQNICYRRHAEHMHIFLLLSIWQQWCNCRRSRTHWRRECSTAHKLLQLYHILQ